MIIKFKWIPPSKKNSKQVFCRWGRPTVIPSKAYKTWHEEMSKELEWIKIPETELWPPYIFTYNFLIPYKKDWSISGRPFDYSNKIESINDLLVDLWIIEDDNYTVIAEEHIYGKYVPYWEGWVVLEIS